MKKSEVIELKPPQSFEGFLWCWKAVEADLTARNDFQYRLGEWAVAQKPNRKNTGACPKDDGDGLCIANTFYGAAQGGRSCRTIIICAYLPADVLGSDADKLRVTKLFVPNWGLWSIERLARQANLSGAYLSRAYLSGADLSGALYLTDEQIAYAKAQGAIL